MKVLALILLAALIMGQALAQQAGYITSDYWIGTRNIDIFSGRIYVSFVNGFKIYDLASLPTPVPIGQYFCENGGGPIEVIYNYAYIVNGGHELRVVDISNPQDPNLVGAFETAHDIVDIHLLGQYLFLAGGPLDIVNLIDPSNPSLIAEYDSTGDITDIEVAGDYAYLANGLGIKIVALSDINNPVRMGFYDSPGFAYSLELQGYYAYVATDSGLEVLLVNNPRFPAFYGRYDAPGLMHIMVDGQIAYTTSGGYGGYFYVIDIQNVYQPTLLGQVRQWGGNDFALIDTAVLSATGNAGLNVISVANPSSPQVLDNILLDSASSEAITINGNMAFLGGSDIVHGNIAEIRALDITNPSQPNLVGSLILTGYANSLFSTDTLLVMNGLGASEGFGIINTTDLQNLYLMGEIRGFGYPKGVFACGDYAYFVCNYCWIEMPYGSMKIVDISDASQPTLVYEQSSNPCGHGIQVRDDYLYVAGFDVFSGPARLDIFNITDPVNPDSVGWVEYPGDAWNFVIHGSYLYLAGRDLYVIDIGNPSSPAFLGTFPTPGEAVDLCAAGNYLFVADRYSGAQVFDISDQSNPQLIESFETPGDAIDIDSYRGHIYVADTYSMIVFGYEPLGVDNDELLPGDAVSLHNYPNPFNAQTTISFALPTDSHVRVDIYDILGRRICAALDEYRSAGFHKLVWNANYLDSGLYFYRIEAGEYTKSKKMTILK